MTFKMLYVPVTKTKLDFSGVYLDFIREYGILSALRRDKKSEMIQSVKEIYRVLIIADQWTEPYSPCQNPAVGYDRHTYQLYPIY
jgi:hypothetical protein